MLYIYEGQNLVPNGDIEILDNGQPVRWNYQGKCAVGFPGFQSDYALTMEVPGQDISAKWEAQVDSIKSHTKYVISFWYRLPEKGKIEVILFGKSLHIIQNSINAYLPIMDWSPSLCYCQTL